MVLASARAVSARTPVGLSAVQSAMSMRAHKLEPRALSLTDKRDQRVGTARVGGLGGDCIGFERILTLAARALGDLQQDVGDKEEVPVVVALPEPDRPDDDPRYGADFIHLLWSRSRVAIDKKNAEVVRLGHAGAAYALERAVALLGRHERVLVGAADSYHHPDVLAWLDEECRLHALDAEDGFIPGEGAAFCLLTRDNKEAQAKLVHVATAIDPSADGETPDTAKAMTQMLHALDEPPKWALNDDNGERHRTRPWVMARIRALPDDATITSLPSEFGDLGAATGMVAFSVVSTLMHADAGAAERCVVALHADRGERGLFVLEAPHRS